MKQHSQTSFVSKIIFSAALLFICFYNLRVSAQVNTASLEKKLDATIDSLYSAMKIPGVSVAIKTPQLNYKKVVGTADLKTGAERTFDEKFRIGSITKTFVGTVILQLADEGRLGLDDKLDKYYPSFPNASSITIRQMLNMTSGIHDYLEDSLLQNSFWYNRTKKFTPQEIYDATAKLKPMFAPGTGWDYSNGGYNILGMIIEKVTGNTLEKEIDSRIVQPLHLTNTSLPTVPDIEGQHCDGYMKDSVTGKLIDVTIIDPSIGWAAGAMVSNMDDLTTYCLALVKGTLISAKMQEQRLAFVPSGLLSYLNYGLGIFSYSGFIGHNGAIPGYNTTMLYHPGYDVLIIVSVNEYGLNNGFPADMIFMKLAETLLPGKKLFE